MHANTYEKYCIHLFTLKIYSLVFKLISYTCIIICDNWIGVSYLQIMNFTLCTLCNIVYLWSFNLFVDLIFPQWITLEQNSFLSKGEFTVGSGPVQIFVTWVVSFGFYKAYLLISAHFHKKFAKPQELILWNLVKLCA
jgi:hypothetical protein